MKHLINAFKGLFITAFESGNALEGTANFALKNVDWEGKLNKPEPMRHPVAERDLEATFAHCGQMGTTSRKVAGALMEEVGRLMWRARSTDHNDGPDVAAFSRNFTATTVIGNTGLLPSEKVVAGFSLQGPDTYYPPHAHHAEESYWIIGGNGDWKVGTGPWFAVGPGDSIYHESGALHTMQTYEKPLLSVWLWTSHLDSEVVIVRE